MIHFGNADLIAQGLAPLDPSLAAIAAGRRCARRAKSRPRSRHIDLHVGKRESYGEEALTSRNVLVSSEPVYFAGC